MYILITNFHSIQNKGDLGIVMGLIGALRERIPQVQFGIVGRYPEERGWWQAQGIDLYTPLLVYPRQSGNASARMRNKFGALYFFFRYHLSLLFLCTPRFARWYYRSSPEALKTLDAYMRADAVLSKGGSFFREPEYRLNIFPLGIFAHLHQIRVGLALGKKIIISPQSFGPLRNPFSRFAIRRVFRQAALVVVRESNSQEFLKRELRLERNVILGGDSAFLLKQTGAKERLSEVRSVGITVRSWSNKPQYESYLNAVAGLIEEFSKKNFTFFLMPQVVGPSSSEDDRISSQKVFSLLSSRAKEQTKVIDGIPNLDEVLSAYGEMDYFIATRLHSAVFALLNGVPVMAIEYEPKTSGIFKDIGMSTFVSDIRILSLQTLISSFENLQSAPRSMFVDARTHAVRSANQTIDAIMKTLEQ